MPTYGDERDKRGGGDRGAISAGRRPRSPLAMAGSTPRSAAHAGESTWHPVDEALQGHRVRRGTDAKSIAEMLTFSGCTIDVPARRQRREAGARTRPRAPLRAACGRACTCMLGFHLVEGAGHWVAGGAARRRGSSCCSRFVPAARDQSLFAARLDGVGHRSRGPCFETHRSPSERAAHGCACSRCDAPRHEAEGSGFARGSPARLPCRP